MACIGIQGTIDFNVSVSSRFYLQYNSSSDSSLCSRSRTHCVCVYICVPYAYFDSQAMFGRYFSTFKSWVKGQILPVLSTYNAYKPFSFRGFRPPDSLTRGSAPGPRWGLRSQTPLYVRAPRSPCAPTFKIIVSAATVILSTCRAYAACRTIYSVHFYAGFLCNFVICLSVSVLY